MKIKKSSLTFTVLATLAISAAINKIPAMAICYSNYTSRDVDPDQDRSDCYNYHWTDCPWTTENREINLGITRTRVERRMLFVFTAPNTGTYEFVSYLSYARLWWNSKSFYRMMQQGEKVRVPLKKGKSITLQIANEVYEKNGTTLCSDPTNQSIEITQLSNEAQ